MCMSEWTSMPAAWGLRTERAGGASRGRRDDLGEASAERLRWLMGSATLGGVTGTTAEVRQEGTKECSFPNGIDASVTADARRQ
jgi:hypothetical protein